MAAITGMGANSGVLANQTFGVRQRQQDDTQNPMAGVAKALGMSADDVASALKSGRSLNDLASQKGVSHSDLLAAIKTGLPDQSDNANNDDLAAQIADQKINKNTTATPNSVSSSTLNAVSSLLDQQSSQDLSSVNSSSDLVNLLQSKGVDLGNLRNVLSSGSLVDVTA